MIGSRGEYRRSDRLADRMGFAEMLFTSACDIHRDDRREIDRSTFVTSSHC